MHPYLNIALSAARAAGNVITRSMERLEHVKFVQKSQNDFVSEIDEQAERVIIDMIRKNYPAHGFLAEESGESKGDEDTTWIIDPIDGTTNFLHGFPHFSISIAVMQKGRIEHGLIYDPIRHEAFHASRGSGAILNNYRMRVSKRISLQGALLGTGFPYRDYSILEPYVKILQKLIPEVGGIRRAGSAALDLAYVAAGRLDGYWEFNLKPWDIAAGSLLVQEAGGLVSDLDGSENFLTSGNIIAATPKVFKSLVQIINSEIKKIT